MAGRGGKRPGAGRKPNPKSERQKRLAAAPPVERTAPRPKLAAVSLPSPVEVIEGGSGIPPEPDWALTFQDELDVAIAHSRWHQLVRELRDTEKLALVNAFQIERLVRHYVVIEQASRHVFGEGAVIAAKGRRQARANKWFAVLQAAESMATKLEQELTITPRRRNNGAKVQKKRPSQIGGGFLKAVPGRSGHAMGA